MNDIQYKSRNKLRNNSHTGGIHIQDIKHLEHAE